MFEKVARFWLRDTGVDGFRMDAVGHFFEGPGGKWKHMLPIHTWLRDCAAAMRRIGPRAFGHASPARLTINSDGSFRGRVAAPSLLPFEMIVLQLTR